MKINSDISIKILSGPDVGKVFRVKEMCFIGNLPSCDIQLTDPGIASMHARIRQQDNAYTLTDLTTDPDIRVNEKLIKSRNLLVGDIIKVANTVMTVIEREEPPLIEPGASKSDTIIVSAEINTVVEREKRIANTLELSPESEEAPDDDARDAIASYRLKGISQQEEQEKKSSKIVWVSLLSIAAVIGIIAAAIWIHSIKSEKRRISASYQYAEEFAKRNPGKTDKIIEEYRKVLTLSSGKHPELETYIRLEIDRIEKEKQEEEKKFADLLVSLDKKADKLVDEEEFEDAINVYNIENLTLRNKVLLERTNIIQRISLQAAEFASMQNEQEKEQEEEDQELAQEELAQILTEVVDAMISGDTSLASELLETIIQSERLAFAKDSAESTITTVRLLRSIDINMETSDVSYEEPVPANIGNIAIPSILKAVFSVRGNNLWEARAYLDESKEHFLYPALLVRAETTPEELAKEKEAIKSFASVWSKITKTSVRKIPLPSKCAKLLSYKIKTADPEEIEEWDRNLLVIQEQYSATRFIQKYSAVFSVIEESPETTISVKVNNSNTSFGDGVIIQVNSNTCFAELYGDTEDLEDMKVSLLEKKSIFLSEKTKKPIVIKAAIEVTTPFKPLSEKQIVFSMPAGSRTPVAGEHIIITKENEKEEIYLKNNNITMTSGWRSVMKTSFSAPPRQALRGTHGSYKISDGKLILNKNVKGAKPENKNAGTGDLLIAYIPRSNQTTIEFDLERQTGQATSIGFGNFQFVIGGLKLHKQGIYKNGRLLKSVLPVMSTANNTEHIIIQKNLSEITLSINNKSARYKRDPNDKIGKINNIHFFSDAPVSIDNLVINEFTGTAKITPLAFDDNQDEVVVLRDKENWENIVVGSKMYFQKENPDGTTKPVGLVLVQHITKDWLVCSIENDIGISKESYLTPTLHVKTETKETPTTAPVMQDLPEADILYGKATLSTNTLKITMNGSASVGSYGYVYPITDPIIHPQTKEVLAAQPSLGIKGKFSYKDNIASFRAMDTSRIKSLDNKNVIISSKLLSADKKIDIEGLVREVPYSSLEKKSFWKAISGEWTDKSSGQLSGSFKNNEIPAIKTIEAFSMNAQYDFSLKIENDSKSLSTHNIKDIMVEIFFPAKQQGITFGLGSGENGGISVYGRSISLNTKTESPNIPYGKLPTNVTAIIENKWPENEPKINAGTEYNLRIRRIGDVLAFYVNGKRLAYVKYPELEGDAFLLAAAPEKSISIIGGSVRSFTGPCVITKKEPSLREFGYVLSVEGSYVTIDSDMNNIKPNAKISIVTIGDVIKGIDSRTMAMQNITQAIVTEVGPKTAKARCIDTDLIKPGMKVLLGTKETLFYITETQLLNIDEGL